MRGNNFWRISHQHPEITCLEPSMWFKRIVRYVWTFILVILAKYGFRVLTTVLLKSTQGMDCLFFFFFLRYLREPEINKFLFSATTCSSLFWGKCCGWFVHQGGIYIYQGILILEQRQCNNRTNVNRGLMQNWWGARFFFLFHEYDHGKLVVRKETITGLNKKDPANHVTFCTEDNASSKWMQHVIAMGQ